MSREWLAFGGNRVVWERRCWKILDAVQFGRARSICVGKAGSDWIGWVRLGGFGKDGLGLVGLGLFAKGVVVWAWCESVGVWGCGCRGT